MGQLCAKSQSRKHQASGDNSNSNHNSNNNNNNNNNRGDSALTSVSSIPNGSSSNNAGVGGISALSGQGATPFAASIKVHSELVNDIRCINPDLIVTACEDKNIELFDWKRRVCEKRLDGHKGAVNRIALTLDGTKIFSASRDTSVIQWNRCIQSASSADNIVQVFKGHDLTVKGVVCNDDGSIMCSGSRDAQVVSWDVETASIKTKKMIAQNLVTCMRWVAQDPHCFLQASEDLRLRVWDSRDLVVAQVYEGHNNIQMWCDVSSDGLYFLSCSNGFDGAGCEVKLWDRRINKLMMDLPGHSQTVTSVAFLPSPNPVCGNAAFAATSSADNTVRIWDLKTATQVCSLQTPPDDRLYCLAAIEVASYQKDVSCILYGGCLSGSIARWNVSPKGKLNI